MSNTITPEENRMKVLMTIEIINVEHWSVNWNDEKATVDEMELLSSEAKLELSKGMGIDIENITIESKLIRNNE
jgi:hypothetical protein